MLVTTIDFLLLRLLFISDMNHDSKTVLKKSVLLESVCSTIGFPISIFGTISEAFLYVFKRIPCNILTTCNFSVELSTGII